MMFGWDHEINKVTTNLFIWEWSVPQYTVWSRNGCPWPPNSASSKYKEASHRHVASWKCRTPRKTSLWSAAGCSAAPTRMQAPTLMWCHFLRDSHLCKKQHVRLQTKMPRDISFTFRDPIKWGMTRHCRSLKKNKSIPNSLNVFKH